VVNYCFIFECLSFGNSFISLFCGQLDAVTTDSVIIFWFDGVEVDRVFHSKGIFAGAMNTFGVTVPILNTKIEFIFHCHYRI